jgi:serine/threonine protein kinase/Tol biopolymer transport system component
MINSTIAHYRITAKLGQGGMGEVYRATDTKLDREVAIKVLPQSFADDPVRVARFAREAKVLASLNHPNIAVLYGIEESGGAHALIMELVEGETLGERLKREPMTVEESLECCKQVAEALEAAHEKGIVHRDLKPENIKIDPEDKVKVLDFGLAKALADPGASSDVAINQADSPTLTNISTLPGQLLGTAPYMSPEQARAKPVDKRSDIWSFGCVLYECLTGKPLFQGEDVTETLATIIKGEPEWAALPNDTPPTIELLLRKCLAKDRKRRLRDIGDARIDIEQALGDPTSSIIRLSEGVILGTTSRRRGLRLKSAGLVLCATLVVAAVAVFVTDFIGWSVWPPPRVEASADVIRFRLDLVPNRHLSGGGKWEELSFALQRPSRRSFALSPDGRYLVYAASDGETTRLYRRPMNQDQATLIPGTDGGFMPFFAPDSRSVGFVVRGIGTPPAVELKRVPVDGGEVRTIAASGSGPVILAASSWTEDDTILATAQDGIYVVPATGGSLARLTQVEPAKGEQVHRYAQMLPNGRAVLFNVATEGQVPSDWTIVVQSLEGGERQTVAVGGSDPRYLPSGHIVFARSGSLIAVPFDVDRLEVTGAPAVVLEDVMHGERGGNDILNFGAAQFSVSNTGSLTYVPGGIYPVGPTSLVWVNPHGKAAPLPLPPAPYLWPRFSPDGTRLSYGIGHFGDLQLWVYDLELELPHELTSTGTNYWAVWSPDGTRLVFSRIGADGGLFSIAADGSGAPERVGEDLAGILIPSAWSTDNVLAFLHSPGPGEPLGIWTLRMDGESQPEPFVATSARWPDFSPDGHWIAYVAADNEVYVRPFPAGAPVRVSPDGGSQPVWSPDGRQLFYTKGNPEPLPDQVMVVDVVTETAFRPSPPRLLFEGLYSGSTPIRSIDISPDGDRFVMTEPVLVEPQPVTEIRVVQNWFTELNEKCPPVGAK